MWISKKKYDKDMLQIEGDIVGLGEENQRLNDRLLKAEEPSEQPEQPEQPECEKCGCLVGGRHVKGESEIRLKPLPFNEAPSWVQRSFSIKWPDVEYIHKPIYCKRCAPKPKKTKKCN